nr:CMP-N-acetylneuraminic acid synthetase [uncultured Flavobacterium sp.]
MSIQQSKRDDIAALIIGRGNNTLKDKNILPVFGIPLLQWGALAAKRSKFIKRYYISSDDQKILDAGKDVGFQAILRPDELATPNAQSADAVRHACQTILNEGQIKILVVIHANVGTISSTMIDECIELMMNDDEISAVIPSHQKDEYHALRARKVNADGFLEPYVEMIGKTVSANRQELGTCLFYDHSFWVLSMDKGINSKNGQQPWTVMGNNIFPYVTEGCFDVHDIDDLKRTEEWISTNGIWELYKSEGLV